MKKLMALLLALLMIFSLVACGAKEEAPAAKEEEKVETPAVETPAEEDPAEDAPVEEGPVYNERIIRFGTTSATGSTAVKAIEVFAEEMGKASDGKITVEIYADAVLGDVSQIVKSTRLGALDMCFTNPAGLVDMGIGGYTIFSLPFLTKNFDQGWEVLDSEVGQNLLGDITNSDLDLVGIGYFKAGPRSLFTTEPVHNLEELAGKQIRVQAYQIDTDMMNALGASPTPVSSAEIYSAMQTGVVDGAENPIDSYYNNKYYEVAPYLTLTEHTDQPVIIMYSSTIWSTLNADEQQLVRDSWKKAEEYCKQEVGAGLSATLEALKAEGVTVIELTDKEKWVEAVQPLYDQYAGDYADIIKQIQAMD